MTTDVRQSWLEDYQALESAQLDSMNKMDNTSFEYKSAVKELRRIRSWIKDLNKRLAKDPPKSNK